MISDRQHSFPRWLEPRRVLWIAVTLTFVITLVAPRVGSIVLLCGTVLGWLCTLAVAAVLPPPVPMAERSTLLRRLFWLLKALWAAVMVGVTATYGGLVAIDLETRMRAGQLESTAPFDLIGLPVLLAAIVLVWVCAMWVAIDLIRGGEIERVRAVDTLFE
jgi:hypothetical protein